MINSEAVKWLEEDFNRKWREWGSKRKVYYFPGQWFGDERNEHGYWYFSCRNPFEFDDPDHRIPGSMLELKSDSE